MQEAAKLADWRLETYKRMAELSQKSVTLQDPIVMMENYYKWLTYLWKHGKLPDDPPPALLPLPGSPAGRLHAGRARAGRRARHGPYEPRAYEPRRTGLQAGQGRLHAGRPPAGQASFVHALASQSHDNKGEEKRACPVTASNGRKPTIEELFVRAQNGIEASREHLAEFSRQQLAFDNSRAKKEAGCMFPHHTETPIERIFRQVTGRKMKRIERHILLRKPKARRKVK